MCVPIPASTSLLTYLLCILCIPQINRNYEINVKKLRRSEIDHEYVLIFTKWLYSICGQCETQSEMEYSLKSLDNWLVQQSSVSPALRSFTQDYFEKSFKAKIDKLCQCYFQHLPGGNLSSNSISEQENSALKRDCMGPKPNSGIDRAIMSTAAHEERRLKHLRKTKLQSLSQSIHDKQNDSEVDNEQDSDDMDLEIDLLDIDLLDSEIKVHDKVKKKIELSKYLTELATEQVIRQYEESANYLYFAESTSCFLVRRWSWTIPSVNNIDRIHHAHVPEFDRTRIVTIENSKYMKNNHGEHPLFGLLTTIFFQDCLVCSCNYFCIHGIPCRHIYCVLQRFPQNADCNIRQFKAFESFLGRDEAITALMSDQVKCSLKGPLVGESLILQPNSRQQYDIAWFNEAMDRIVLRPGIKSYYSQDNHGAIATVTNCQDSSDDDICYGNYDDNEDNEQEEDKKVENPFQSMLPTMAGIYNLIERESDLSILKKYLNMARNELLQKQSGKVRTGTGTTSLVSYPETDRRKTDTRKRPASSPSKKGTK